MREIKFRGKYDFGKRWLYGDLRHIGNIVCIYSGTDANVGSTVDPETVGQFTGLLDKNGREVYEGDILANSHDVRVIEWRDYEWSMVSHTHPFQKTVPMIWIGGYKVCGNVHDNPELLVRKP